jgi:hypothetical protein
MVRASTSLPEGDVEIPTPQMSSEAVATTSYRWPSRSSPGLGVGNFLHSVPSQRMATERPNSPTAHTSVGETAATASTTPVIVPTGEMVQVVPSQCMINGTLGSEGWSPTAHTSSEAVPETPPRVAPDGPGLGTTSQHREATPAAPDGAAAASGAPTSDTRRKHAVRATPRVVDAGARSGGSREGPRGALAAPPLTSDAESRFAINPPMSGPSYGQASLGSSQVTHCPSVPTHCQYQP